MIVTKRLAILLAIGILPLSLASVFPLVGLIGLAYVAVIIILGLMDRFLTPDTSCIEVERGCEDKLSLGAENPITLRVRNKTKAIINLIIRDEPPHMFAIDGNVAHIELKSRQQKEVTYHVNPHARGDFDFKDVYVRLMGPMKMICRQYKLPMARPVKVYPNLLDVRKYDLYLRRGRILETGSRKVRLYGRGTEFESLREYVPDDEFRQVDWKASARRGKLMSRHYQVERSQNVLILLDAGRTMSVKVEEMTKLDYSINAALMLAYVASSGDDKVGLMTFSDKVDRFLPPTKGRAQALAIMEALYNVPLTTLESDYAQAFLYMARRWRKRSLVVVFSDLLDPESSRQIITHLQTLAHNHLCICVAISDTNVLRTARAVPEESSAFYEKAAAVELLHERQQAIAALTRTGVIVIDSEPGTLSPAVINQYLQVKGRLML